MCRNFLCFPDGIVSCIRAIYFNKVGCTMNKKVLFPVLFGAMAVAANASPAADSLSSHLTTLGTDVTNTIGPAAIGLAVAIAMVVVGRSFIKKFFKA